MNLTRIPSESVVPLHFLDSLTVSQAFDLTVVTAPVALIDVGTGAGFPGLPLKIAFPHLSVTLLDSTRKRLGFLDRVIEELGLKGIETVHLRAEAAGRDHRFREQFDLVTARAVASLPVLAEYLLPLARVGGTVIAMKSASIADEVKGSEPAIAQLGGAGIRIKEVSIPGEEIERRLVVIGKSRQTHAKYPRDSAAIKARPL